MTEPKFTPGPWRYKAGRKSHHEWARLFTAKRGRTFLFGTEALSIPDCHLIAAAPDLYEALSDLIKSLKDYQVSSSVCDALEQGKRCLAKARGE